MTRLGVAASAAISFAVGRWLGRDALERLPWTEKADSIHRRIAERGLVAIAALRIVPVAPFVVINLVAGASRIRMRDFMLATVIAMAPGTFVMVYYGSQLLNFGRGASFVALLGIAAVVIGVAALAWWVEKTLDSPRRDTRGPAA